MSSFVVSKTDLKNFMLIPKINQQEGIRFAYETNADTLPNIVPPNLEVIAPYVCGYVCQIKEPSFGGPYMESCLYLLVKVKGTDMIGAYPMSLMLSGPGAESGLLLGRDGFAIPKKFADHMDVRHNGEYVSAKIIRHGVTLLELEAKLDGQFNTSLGSVFVGSPKLGEATPARCFYFKYDVNQTEKGNCEFSNVKLISNIMSTTTTEFVKGKLSLKLTSSPDDPYGELEFIRPVGAAYYKYSDAVMASSMDIMNVDAEEYMPYLLSARYDRGLFGDDVTYLSF